MSLRLRALLLVLGTFLFALLAYLPLFRAGLLAQDYAVLLAARGDVVATPQGDGAPVLAPLARLSLAASRTLWGLPGPQDSAAAFLLRLEHVALLTLGALGLGCAVRRLLLPWTGSDHGRAAGWATTLFVAIHPLAVPAVASLEARGGLLALCFGAWALEFFLKGRQDRVGLFAPLCFLLCVLAGMSADFALGLPFVLAGAELFSAHRYRPLRVRLRTAATTLVVFGLAAGLETILHVGRVGGEALPALARVLAGDGVTLATAMGRGTERLGLFVLPSNPFVTELAGLALAGAVFLLAMHPGLAAARAAPRLWGWVLLLWFLALCGSVLFYLHVPVDHAEFAEARVLLSSAAVMAVGMAIGSTALSGMRRILYPCVVAMGYAAIAHANALPWRLGAEITGDVRADLLEACERFGNDVRLLLLEPPGNVRGLRPVGDSVNALVHPALDPERRARAGELEVLAMSAEAFTVFVDQPELTELRAQGLAVVFPAALVDGAEAGVDTPGARERRSLFLPPPIESGRPLAWRGTLRSPNLDVEALSTGVVLVSAPSDPDFVHGQHVSWRSRERSLPDGSCPGFWYEDGEGVHGVFDVGSSLAWRLGDRIKRIWFEGGLQSVDQASVGAALPSLGTLTPEAREHADWVFPVPAVPLVEAAGEHARFVCVLLDLATHRLITLTAARREPGRLVFEDALHHLRAGRGPFVWRLELRVGELALAHSSGRAAGVAGGAVANGPDHGPGRAEAR